MGGLVGMAAILLVYHNHLYLTVMAISWSRAPYPGCPHNVTAMESPYACVSIKLRYELSRLCKKNVRCALWEYLHLYLQAQPVFLLQKSWLFIVSSSISNDFDAVTPIIKVICLLQRIHTDCPCLERCSIRTAVSSCYSETLIEILKRMLHSGHWPIDGSEALIHSARYFISYNSSR